MLTINQVLFEMTYVNSFDSCKQQQQNYFRDEQTSKAKPHA